MSRKKRERQAREKKKRKALEKALRKAQQNPISAYDIKFVVTAPKLDPRMTYIQGGY